MLVFCRLRKRRELPQAKGDIVKITVEDLEAGLYAAKVVCYAQGLSLIQKASADFGYGVDIART